MATIQHPRPTSRDDNNRRPPSIPPSPTLSNPDMILPFDEGERESQTPSPPFNLPSLSNLQQFYGSTLMPGDYSNQINTGNSNQMTGGGVGGGGGMPIGVAYSRAPPPPPPAKKNFGRHTGHRLSDIGEEEGPLPPPRRSSAHFGRFPVNAPVAVQDWRGQASPAGGGAAARGRTGEENGNGNGNKEDGASPSTPTDRSQTPQQQSFEGPEQKSTVNGHSLHMGVSDMANGRGATTLMPVAEGAPADEPSSVVLSSEAERILDNAKKRLNLMEGNLTRARSSMRASPSLSASPSPSPANQPLGLGQPVGGLYQSISRSDRQASAALRPRPMYSTYQDAAGNRHSRVLSETNIPSSAQAIRPVPEASGLSRSVSAMGSTSLSSFQRDERSFRYDPNRSYLTHRASTPSMQQQQQQQQRSPLANSFEPNSKESTPCASPGLGVVSDGNKQTKISNMDDFNSVYPADPPSRTQSQLQVHDLQDQMKGLHIKISSLKVKTQEDNLRRRSLQSLRTPSPLTEADPWFVNAMEYRDRRGHLSPNPSGTPRMSLDAARDAQPKEPEPEPQPGPEQKSEPEPEPESAKEQRNESEDQAAADAPKQTNGEPQPTEEAVETFLDAEESQYDDDETKDIVINREELDEILREPLDDDLNDATLDAFPAVPHAEATPHEEREDAFDYEHFILHSALGNYSQSRLRRGSNASVETTRPVHGRHSRANSATSLSSAATFATAAEGENDFNGVLYWDRKFNDELRARHRESYESLHQSDDGPNFETPMVTPRTSQRFPRSTRNSNSHDPNSTTTTNGSTQNLTSLDTDLEPPQPPRSESTTTGSATPTALASSLVSTVRAASSSPWGGGGGEDANNNNDNKGINNDDERLLEQLFQSLGDVCMDLQTITTSAEPDMKGVRVLRRRLDAARRVLDGELDA